MVYAIGDTDSLAAEQMIAALRADMCRAGIGWRSAHDAATEVVGERLTKAGAKRPRWKEGQPEWTDGGEVRHQRIRCANCDGMLDPENRIFCSKHCFDAHRGLLRYQDNIIVLNLADRLHWAGRGVAHV